MGTKKSLLIDDWQERLQLFSSGNRGRQSAIATKNMTIAENKKFRDIEYDPVGKGNDIVIALEGSNDTFRHIVQAPVEILIEHKVDGVVSSLEIINQNGEPTYLRFYEK